MNKTLHKLSILSAGIMLSLFTVAVMMASIFPVPSALETAQVVAQRYADHAVRIRIGLVIGMFAAAFAGPFTAALAWETQRMVGGKKTIAANIQVIFGTIFLASLFFPFLQFMGASFRPLEDINVTHGIYSMAFITFVAPVSVGVLQMWYLGAAMLMDCQPVRTFPRWFAYYTLFVGFDFAGGGFCVLTKTGPFAWDGLISFYIPFVTWGFWCWSMVFFMTKSANREYADDASGGSDDQRQITLLTGKVAVLQARIDAL